MLELRFNRPGVVMFMAFLTLSACGRESASEGGTGEGDTSPAAFSASQSSEAAARPDAVHETALSSSGEEHGGYWLGEPRDDLERFFGLYGDTNHPGRDFFVAEAKRPEWAEQAPEIPPGYLVIGAMWGDVSPWNMKAVSDTRFEQQSLGDVRPAEPIGVVFEVGEDKNAVGITFETVFDDRGPLKRLGDLPEEWR